MQALILRHALINTVPPGDARAATITTSTVIGNCQLNTYTQNRQTGRASFSYTYPPQQLTRESHPIKTRAPLRLPIGAVGVTAKPRWRMFWAARVCATRKNKYFIVSAIYRRGGNAFCVFANFARPNELCDDFSCFVFTRSYLKNIWFAIENMHIFFFLL